MECKHYAYNYKQKPNKNNSKFKNEYLEYVCNYNGCNKIFNRLGLLNNHKKIHLKLYKCLHCNKKFGAKKDLKIHERIHTGERPEICKMCLKCFKDPSALRKHIKYIHFKKKLFICKKCKKTFARKNSLQMHYATHIQS
eukprot:331419_1